MRTERLLRRQHIALEKASAIKSQFLANVARVRTPQRDSGLHPHDAAGRGGGDVAGPEAQSHPLDRTRDTFSDLSTTSSISPVSSRPDAAQYHDVRAERPHPGSAARDGADRRPGSQLEVTLKISNKLPPLKSDRQKVKQIVLNLLSNALKFRSRCVLTSAPPTIRARRWRSSSAGYRYRDCSARQAHVFEEFRQLDSSPSRGMAVRASDVNLQATCANARRRYYTRKSDRAWFDIHASDSSEAQTPMPPDRKRPTAHLVVEDIRRRAGDVRRVPDVTGSVWSRHDGLEASR